MRRFFLFFIGLLACEVLVAQTFTVKGGGRDAYRYPHDASTGLDGGVFVVFSTNGATIEFSGVDVSPVSWYTFDENGAAMPTPVSGATQTGSTSTLPITRGDCGYMVEQGGKYHYIWVIDYSQSPLILKGVSVSNDAGQCDNTTLLLDGTGNTMYYYSINRARYSLEHELSVSYMTLTWEKDAESYLQTDTTVFRDFDSDLKIQVPAPLCNTDFRVEGDQMLRFWGMPQWASTDEYTATAVEAQAVAEQAYRDDALNEDDRHPNEYLGGSAPAEVEFRAYTTDAVSHIEWQFSSKQDFSTILARYNDEVLHYTFRDEGISFVRLVASNSTAECVYETDPITINIGEPRLEAPNMFTPGTSPGVNDEWKVAYKSLLEFKCWIFNKWGVEVFYFDNPEKGWDGKYRGKYVDPGVYYYVIRAKGANNKEMKLKGHINILRSKD